MSRTTRSRVRGTAAVAAMVLLAACSSSSGRNGTGTRTAAARGTTWADYVVAKVGRSCTLHWTDSQSGSEGSTTDRTTSVAAGPDGTVVSTSRTRSSRWGTGGPRVVQEQDTHLLRSDGRYEVREGAWEAGGVRYAPQGGYLLPSVAESRAGVGRTTRLAYTISVQRPRDAKTLASWRAATSDGTTVFRYDAMMTAQPVSRAPLAGSNGDYPDTVGMELTLTLVPINARAGDRQAAEYFQFAALAFPQHWTAFYARGIGLVEIEGQQTEVLNHPCTG